MRSVSMLAAIVALAAIAAACHPKAPSGPPSQFGDVARMDHAFRGDIYYLAEGTPKLPDFRRQALALHAVGHVYAQQLNVPTQNFQVGFPGVSSRTTWFAIDYKGGFTVAAPGTYAFRLSSDDGSKLYIDGKPVVDDDGVHATASASGTANLSAGAHSIEVQYFQGPPTEVALQLFCAKPGGAEAIFPGCGVLMGPPPEPMGWIFWVLIVIVAGLVIWLFTARRKPPAAPKPE